VHPSIRRVCVHFPRFGPLQLNRTRAAHDELAREGIETVALEVASSDAIYLWREEHDATPYERTTLFPGQRYDDIAPRAMHNAVFAALDRMQPNAMLIHSYSTPDARACLLWCRRNRRVAVLVAESTQSDGARVPWREAVKRTLVRQFDAALVSGTRSLRYAIALGIPEDRAARGYSVVDNDYFWSQAETVRHDPSSARTRPGLDDATPFFLASARFIERKDLPTLLSGYRRYRERSTNPWRLVLLGDGPLRPAVAEMLKVHDIQGVSLPGWQQIDALPAYYALASAFVHPAIVDQWGLVVNEAMASGLPVVVSTGAGCSTDLVREGVNGFTFDPRDPEGLAVRLRQVAHETDRQAMGSASREIVAAFPLSLFGQGLYRAIEAGYATSKRGPSPGARALIEVLRVSAKHARSFHSVES
jgi:glycosyltransferase involved in cell wall biosynthesis